MNLVLAGNGVGNVNQKIAVWEVWIFSVGNFCFLNSWQFGRAELNVLYMEKKTVSCIKHNVVWKKISEINFLKGRGNTDSKGGNSQSVQWTEWGSGAGS